METHTTNKERSKATEIRGQTDCVFISIHCITHTANSANMPYEMHLMIRPLLVTYFHSS